jgi:signal recognition particle GTPase
MQVEIKVDAEAVQQRLVQALIDSAVGKHIENAISEVLTKQYGDWNNRETVIESAVRSALQNELHKLVGEALAESRDKLRQMIATRLDDESLTKMTDEFLSRIWKER